MHRVVMHGLRLIGWLALLCGLSAAGVKRKLRLIGTVAWA